MSAPKRKSSETKAIEAGLVLSENYWAWLTDAHERDITELSETTRWDFLLLEAGLTDLSVQSFRDRIFNAVTDGLVVVRPIRHKPGDGERLAAALAITL